jgi:hypothetical protein
LLRLGDVIFSAVLLIFVAWNFYMVWRNSFLVERAKDAGVAARGTYFIYIDHKDPRCPPDLRFEVLTLQKNMLGVNIVLIALLCLISKLSPL